MLYPGLKSGRPGAIMSAQTVIREVGKDGVYILQDRSGLGPKQEDI